MTGEQSRCVALSAYGRLGVWPSRRFGLFGVRPLRVRPPHQGRSPATRVPSSCSAAPAGCRKVHRCDSTSDIGCAIASTARGSRAACAEICAPGITVSRTNPIVDSIADCGTLNIARIPGGTRPNLHWNCPRHEIHVDVHGRLVVEFDRGRACRTRGGRMTRCLRVRHLRVGRGRQRTRQPEGQRPTQPPANRTLKPTIWRVA